MLEQDFKILMDNLGIPIYLNDEPSPRTAIISTRTVNTNSYDDRNIHTDFPIKRGDMIKFNEIDYIVFSDVQGKRAFEYKAIIRPTTNTIPIVVQEEEREIIDWDDFMRPIYGDIIQEEVIEDVPCIIEQETFSISGSQIVIAKSEISIIMGDNHKSKKISVNDEHILFNNTFKVTNVNLFKQGLRIFTAERRQN